ncbi:ATP-dependent DNA helicase DinG [Dasania sp. GY-MA-18]|uniref:ATP-dependent DNA helicase DinG n=1 Tax=Dasania phycosphaerae TaxID=2950436 RepID=A0A9J6RQ66_9GAMM|nr:MULTISPECIES: ATP-dependent DNA helicase DinG [Dasania]MCR8924142.1 ATP-dependent DNA helicase DinG [Dasania sp. GY-MA-18]MCZ0866715.1 ATP-dependent DNA helicase DinG [Dasania phycosphaerae]MCZ0870300.1 ATP-dependent DNA helicase DinG [Dasania phycosphaerae]
MLTDELKAEIQGAYRHLLDSKSLKPRLGQRLMMAEVARTLAGADMDANGHREGSAKVCVAEAGTGTGKTIAYTLSAIPIAKALDKTLIISTATVALQEQVVHKDLPDILQHSGLHFTFALAKGRGRYLCLSKLDSLLQGTNSNHQSLALYPDEMQQQVQAQDQKVYDAMLNSLSTGDWDGDRDNWPDELEVSLWSRVTTDHAQCTGRRCPNIRQCYFYKGREALDKVDVIVANHDLVLADLSLGGGAILPDPEDCIYIFDEGHHLPEKAINHFSQFSRVRSTERWLDQGAKALAKAAPELSTTTANQYIQRLPAIMDSLKQQLGMLFNHLEANVQTQPDQRGAIPYHRFAQGIVPEPLRLAAQELAGGFRDMHDLLDKACNILEEAINTQEHGITGPEAEAWYSSFSMLRSRAEGNQHLWQDYSGATAVEEPPQGRWVAVVEGAGGQLDFEVSSSPILAANTLQRYLWSRCFSAVVTSATITALGSFERFMMRAGTPADAAYIVVPSPFNHAEAGELVVPAMRSEPSNADAHTEELIELLPQILAADSGSLVLFSSKRQLENVYDGLPLVWRQKILRQSDYSKQEVLRRHRAAIDDKQQSILFGLASFAEGVDLPGDYCSHVVIAKIPFAVPDQPVEAALSEWIELRGGNPFMDISVPDASLRLIQASGRLLRTESDSGKVTLLDRRVVSKRYGRALLDALPPFRHSLG